jgi:phage-related tail fiber protein
VSLAPVGTAVNTYGSVSVDANGRITAGTNPTTLSGHGITDAVVNGGQTGAVVAGTNDANSTTIKTNGTNRVIVSSGGQVEMRGQMRSVSSTGATYDNTTTNVDWDRGNAQSMSVACTATTFTNMVDGGMYSLAVSDTTATTCVFAQSGLTFYYNPVNQSRTAGARTVYSFQRYGTAVYVSWIAGFQQ